MSRSPGRSLSPTAWWVIICSFFNCCGWGLSWIGQLNGAGYAVAIGLGLAAPIAFRKKLLPSGRPQPSFVKLRRRFRRCFPLAFLVLAALAILGGLLYRPSNPDGLTHRIPRVLHWLAEGHWYWLQDTPSSFNTRATGFEWLMAPMLALLKTDRWVFLLNGFSYLLLPGLVFSAFWRLGVSRRTAWYWMWLVPTGYVFLLQAGSIGNDAIGAVFALAAVDFALRARESRQCADVWLSTLAAALLSTSKTSNLALLLPWLLAIAPSLPLLRARLVATMAVGVVALGASFFPTAVANYTHTRDWLGAASEMTAAQRQVRPLVAFAGNALNLAVQNLLPPVFPAAGWWNEHAYKWLPGALRTQMEASFEAGGAHLGVTELQMEVNAGIGFGVAGLLLISLVAAPLVSQRQPRRSGLKGPLLVRLSPWVSLLAYMVRACLSTSGRILAPFYALLLPSLLTGPGHEALVRRRGWQALGFAVFCVAAVVLVLSPARPLWPAQSVMSRLAARFPHSPLVARAEMLYQNYAVRWDALAPVRALLPAGERKVGLMSFISSTTLETSLWRPFGSRRVVWIGPQEEQADILQKGIRFVAIGAEALATNVRGKPFEQWVREWAKARHGKLSGPVGTHNTATRGLTPWFVIELPPASPGQ